MPNQLRLVRQKKAAETFNFALVLRLSFFLIAAKVAREIELGLFG